MKLRYLLLISGIALLLNSCSQVFSPALYHQDIAYQPKPTSFDTAKTVNYISGGLYMNSGTNYDDVLVSGQFNISRGMVYDNFNLAYGAFGTLGDYQNSSSNKTAPNYFADKFFGAVGGRFSANAFVTSGRTEFRFIGMEAAYSHEFGSYANYRQMLQSQGGNYVDPRTDLFSIGLTTEIIFHNRNNNDFQHGIRGFLGTTLGHNNLDDTYYKGEDATALMFHRLYPKASYFITFKRYFATAEIGENLFLRFGLKF